MIKAHASDHSNLFFVLSHFCGLGVSPQTSKCGTLGKRLGLCLGLSLTMVDERVIFYWGTLGWKED